MDKTRPPRVGIIHKAAHFLPLILFALALAVVHHEIRLHPLTEIKGAIGRIPVASLLAAAGLTAVNYLALAGYDLLALRYAGHRLPLRKVILASLIGYAISNNTGHSWASGGSVRYRFYTSWGLPGWDVLKISAFLGITYILGVLTLGLAGILLMPADMRGGIENPQILPVLTAICALSLLAYWALVLFYRKPLVLGNATLSLPGPAMTLAQTLVSSIDLLLAALILWVLLPGGSGMGFETFLVIYVVAQVAGLLSQVPGGIGVFEGAFLWLAGATVPDDMHLALIGALALYRAVYFFLPLALAGASLLLCEIYERRKILAEGGKAVVTLVSGVIPQIFSVLLLLTGGVLLVSGATPSVPENMQWLRHILPLPVIEISHLLGSLTGLLLLFLARGILLRLDAAWYASVVLLAAAIAASLLKGFDWREALAAGAMLLLLLPAHSCFRRKSSLVAMALSPSWTVMIAIILAGTAWLGFFAYRHVDYANDMWWQFSYRGDAPRFMRALLLTAVAATGWSLFRLLGVARPANPSDPTPAMLDKVEKLARSSGDSRAFLALTGDKKLFWNEGESAFVMFADTPGYWIAMGDPIGDRSEFAALLWRFREEADSHGAKIVFYEAAENCLPFYLDLGLTLLKIGENAQIPLARFSLEGGRRENMRKNRNRFRKNGFTFTLLEGEERDRELPRLRAISDAWLARRNTREKRFSLGFFDESYIRRTPVAAVRDPQGTIMAFANLWMSADKTEISIDLMRYDPAAPSGIMEYLLTELILKAQEDGYIYFGLGMAPLAGLERRPLAPVWHRIGAAIFDYGDEFYNFEGLYAYKARFDPEWQPRYLALPAGPKAPAILLRIASLIAGGVKGIFTR